MCFSVLSVISMKLEFLRNVNKLSPVLLKHTDILVLRKAEVYFLFWMPNQMCFDFQIS